MSVTGYIKGQLTKAANALRLKKSTVDVSILDRLDPTEDPGESFTLLHNRKTALLNTSASLRRASNTLKEKWTYAENYAYENPGNDGSHQLLEEFQSHWESNGLDDLMEEVEELIIKIETALALLPLATNTQTPQYISYPTSGPADRTPNVRTKDDEPELKVQCTRAFSNRPTTDYRIINAADGPGPTATSELCSAAGEHELHRNNTHGNTMSESYNKIAMAEQHLKLPKLELPDFSGDIHAFPEFWDLFSAAVHNNPTVPPALKLLHLRSKLKGNAKELIAAVHLTENNYEEAVRLLLNTYNRPDILRNRLWEQLEALPQSSVTPVEQRTMLCKIKAVWVQLRKLEEQPGATGTMRLIRSKFPKYTREKVGELRKKDDHWTVEELIQAFDKVINQFEVMEDTDPHTTLNTPLVHLASHRESSPSNHSRKKTKPNFNPRYTSPLRKFTEQRCPFCVRRGHDANACKEVRSPNHRRRLVVRMKLCWKCLATGHRSSQCQTPPCRYCDRNHHSALCFNRDTSSRSRERESRYQGVNRHRQRREESREKSTSRQSSTQHSRSSSSSGRSLSRSPDRGQNRRRSPSPYPRVGFADQRRELISRQNTTCTTLFNPTLSTDDDECDDSEETFYVNSVHLMEEPDTSSNTAHTSNESYSSPRLMVVNAVTYNFNTKKNQRLTILLDSGSQHSYIRKSTAIQLGLVLEEPRPITTIAFGGHRQTEESFLVHLTLQDQHRKPLDLTLWTRETITSIPRSYCPTEKIVREQASGDEGTVDVDILIGINYYWEVMTPNHNQQLNSGLIRSRTRFGPVLSGTQNRTPFHTYYNATSLEADELTDKTDRMIRQLFETESAGVTEESRTEASEIMQQYYNTVKVADGLIYVKFPWKSNYPHLPDNKALAMRRLENQYAKLHADPKAWQEYSKTFEQQLKSGIIEDVKEMSPTGRIIYYIPHQAVYKADSATTKLRIVFDASSHCRGAPSLNDCVHQGPTMLPDLCGTLIRGRLTPFLITADVEKAFHQIRLQEDQRDATRFLWLKDPTKPPSKENIRILRFTRIPFGVNASPYLLSMSIKYALERDEKNQLREEILGNTYVDNLLIGANSVTECILKQKHCKDTFTKMHMNLRQFMSNSEEVRNNISKEDRMSQTSNTVKLLGILWDPRADTIGVAAKASSKEVTTKRTALMAFASTFDPLGFLTPLFVKAKIFIQDLWQKNYTWDHPLDNEDIIKWKEIVQGINHFAAQVPRFIGNISECKYDLVVFFDASERIFAAVAYLVCRPLRGQPFSNLIISKSRLAPLKKTTIPRLQLLAIGLATKLVMFLHKELKIRINSVQILSDSQIALYWIHSRKSLKTFSNNRVKNIKNALEQLAAAEIPSRLHYLCAGDNPADCVTRGLNASEIKHHIWWHGPPFILDLPSQWPNAEMDFTSKPPTDEEAEKELRLVTAAINSTYESFVPFRRINSYTKLIRVVALALKYLSKLYFRVKKKHGNIQDHLLSQLSTSTHITTDDHRAAEVLILREHYRETALQLRTKIANRLQINKGEDGLYRGNLRMAHSSMEDTAKAPILLMPGHPLTKTVASHYHHKLLHAGAPHLVTALRMKFLIPKIRRLANEVIAKCVTCKRHQGRCYSYPTSPDLPRERVRRSRPFQNTGLDYLGPLTVRSEQNQEHKTWVCLFTCMTTRALHLEVVRDNSTAQFLLAFRRFIARRGTPELVLSDNARTFKLGREILLNEIVKMENDEAIIQFTTENDFEWNFITPLSPWKGGFYDRLVGSVKTALRKTVHRQILDLPKFETVICEIESILNTRPLTSVTTNSGEEAKILRPIDLINPEFRLGNLNGPISTRSVYRELNDTDTQESLILYYTSLHDSLDAFWRTWQKEYLQALGEKNALKSPKKHGAKTKPNVGDVVLIRQEGIHRSHWPLGLIVQLNTSKDGALRSVRVKTGKNTIVDRSVNQLLPLEISSMDDQTTRAPKGRVAPTRYQPPRAVKLANSRQKPNPTSADLINNKNSPLHVFPHIFTSPTSSH